MELLRQKIQDKFEELVTINEAMAYVEKKLAQHLDFADAEHFHREEFRLSMDMASVYEDLQKLLTEAAKDKEHATYASNVANRANKIMKVGGSRCL